VLHQTFPQHTFLMNGLIHGVKVRNIPSRLLFESAISARSGKPLESVSFADVKQCLTDMFVVQFGVVTGKPNAKQRIDGA